MSAAIHQLNADFLFESADLPAERWLGRVELLLGGNGQAACISYGNEVAEMPELHHNLPCLASMGPAYKVLFRPASGLYKQKANVGTVCLTGRADRAASIRLFVTKARALSPVERAHA
jgi:hypothetical protein